MASEEGSTFPEVSSDPSSMPRTTVVGSGGSTVSEMGFLMSSSEEDALMMDRPFLDYINEMLMDEAVEEYQPFLQQDRTSYQAIVSGFYDIIGERTHTAPISCSGIDDIDGESFVPLQSFSDIDGGSISSLYSGDEQLYRLESLDDLNSFHNISGAASPSIRYVSSSDHFNAFASISGSGDELARPDLCDSTSIEDGWVDRIINSSPDFAAVDNSSDGHTSLAETPTNGDAYIVKEDKDLEVDADYKKLYVDHIHKHHYDGKPQLNGLVEKSQLDGQANSKGSNGHSTSTAIGKKKGPEAEGMSGKRRGKRNGKSDVCVSLDSRDLLVSCAQAVAVGDGRKADKILQQLRASGASANGGNGLQRTLHYFCKALEARMHGTGSRLYNDTAYENRPSTADLLKAWKVAFSYIPLIKVPHYFANQSILREAEGATHLHIVDYGIHFGFQWPCLINALADRKGGPPKLIITGIEFPQPGSNPAEGLEDIGRRLSEYAKTYKVPFEYHAVATSKWEDANPILEGPPYGRKVLVLNCINRLQNILDECVSASGSPISSQREKLLVTMCNLKPDLFVVANINAVHNSPFFLPRFRDALNYYSYKFDMIDTTMVEDSPERMILERDCMHRDILNVVACEGAERVERPENYKQWQARFQRAGFEHIPIVPSVLSRSKSYVQSYYHRNFTVEHDSNQWMLMSWKGRPTEVMSAWKPKASIKKDIIR